MRRGRLEDHHRCKDQHRTGHQRAGRAAQNRRQHGHSHPQNERKGAGQQRGSAGRRG
nr:MAG TPA: hypothetical protein [Caudoviricetes sp.]